MNQGFIAFGGKAGTLERLRPHLRNARVLAQICFSARRWMTERALILAEISRSPIAAGRMIVRSAASAEDRQGASLAGHFVSVGNVEVERLAVAIDEVYASFGAQRNDADEIFVQPMLVASMSGVFFTIDPNTAGPYLVINYEEMGDTAAVTSGKAANLRTHICWKGADVPCRSPFDKVALLAAELETLLGEAALDVEFAFDGKGDLYLFQVRPLGGAPAERVPHDEHRKLLDSISRKISQANQPHPYLRGRRTLYGVMPDWNPAEIIGIRPRPLSLSLYRELVTDSIWAYQRHNYGYRDLRSFPLMLSFHGLPYIDVRVSFNSFIPRDVSDSLADRLVDCYVDQLAEAPVLHDKVEFEIVHSCYAFDIQSRLSRLLERGFSSADAAELTFSLRNLTNRIINRDTGLWRKDAARIQELEQRLPLIRQGSMDILGRLYWLKEDCKRYGTLPFAGLARAGFIAVQMLRSLVAVGAIEPEQYDFFMQSLETVGKRMTRDMGRLTRAEFLAEYGHLRPGTYDVLSLRYDEDPERYLGSVDGHGKKNDEHHHADFALSLPQMRGIADLLRQHELGMDVVELFEFFQAAIVGREHAKFVFTKSLSAILSLLVELGEQHGFSREDISYLDIGVVDQFHVAGMDVKSVLARSIENGKVGYADTRRIVLPPIIAHPDEVWAFDIPPTEPNFVTQRAGEGAVCLQDASAEKMAGAFIFIPSADPGYDWIFSRGIAGFVTAYGGVNSHMAIRAGELNIPAVIGAGETLYNQWKSARRIRVDCATRRVEML